jgi:hypothetical protein
MFSRENYTCVEEKIGYAGTGQPHLKDVRIKSIAIQLSDDRFLDLKELVEWQGVTPEPLIQANIEAMLALPKREQ